ENDYIRDYARRYSRFPQESTGDQFFSEEQFEVYRALGFHMMHGALCGNDHIQVVGTPQDSVIKFDDPSAEPVRRFRAALMSCPPPLCMNLDTRQSPWGFSVRQTLHFGSCVEVIV